MSNNSIILKNAYLGLSVFFIIYFLIRYHLIGENVSNLEVKSGCLYLLILYAVSITIWIKVSNRLLTPFTMFFCACFLFNSGQLILYFFDIEIANWFVIVKHYSSDIMLKMICFQSLCVIAMTCGALIALNSRTENIMKMQREYVALEPSNQKIDVIDIFFGIICVLTIVSFLTSLSMRGSMSYTDYYYSNTSGSNLKSLIRYIFHILFYYELIRSKKGKKRSYIIAIGLIIAVLMILVGSRFNVITIIGGIIFILLYVHNESYNVKLWHKCLLVSFGLVALSLMRGLTYLRNYSLSSISWTLIKDVYSGGLLNGLYGTLAECGKSANCLLTTMEQFNQSGVTHEPTLLISLLLGFVPSKIASFFGVPVNISLSEWVTKLIGTSNGQGYSLFAECFYNMGVWGFVIMLAVGYAFIRTEKKVFELINTNRVGKIIIACSLIYIMTYAIFLARAESILISTPIRRYIYIWFIVMFLYSTRKRRHMHL